MKGLTFLITFFTAHFKQHKAKRFRDTYLMPLPSTIAGIVGGIFGIDRQDLLDWVKKHNLYCGAKLITLQGTTYEYSKLWKFKNFNQAISTPEYVKILFEPTYIFAVAATDSVIDELYRRLSNLDFEYTIYGGSDYHFVKEIGKPRIANIIKSDIGEGYCRISDFMGIITENGTSYVVSSYVRGDIRDNFVFVFNGKIRTKMPLLAVDDGKNRIFVYESSKFLSV